MTITVEDGTIVSGANSYVTTTELADFAENRGQTDIANASDDELEAALVKASDYMQQKFRLWWKGSRIEAFQSLDWPRRGVDVPDFFDPFFKQANVPISFQDTLFVPEDTIPQEIKDGQCLLAMATFSGSTSSGTLQPSLGRTTKREKLGDLEVEYMDAIDGHTRITQVYWDAERTVGPYLMPQQPYSGRIIRS